MEPLPKPDPSTILIVEDDKAIGKMCSELIQSEGHKPTWAPDAESALLRIEDQLASGKPFDIIFLDLQLPGISGTELCWKIRDEKSKIHSPSTWIIAFTAHKDPKSILDTLSAGANDYLIKPASPELIKIKTTVARFAQARMRGMQKRILLLEQALEKMAKNSA